RHVELTGTNRPSGLASTTPGLGGDSQTRVHASTVRFPRCGRGTTSPWCFGGHSEGETPGPIPNPEVKLFSADGTARGTAWESRTPPDIVSEGRFRNGGGPHCCVPPSFRRSWIGAHCAGLRSRGRRWKGRTVVAEEDVAGEASG